MSTNLEDRKKQVVEECLERYSTKPRKWWQGSPDNIYKPTWNIYKEKNYPRVFADEIIIRKNKGDAVFALVAASVMSVIITGISLASGRLFFQLLIPILSTTLVYFAILNLLDRKPQLIINKEGLLPKSERLTIPWANMVFTCIRKDYKSSDLSYYLRIHYYNPGEDEFKMTEYNIGSLEKEPDTIACFVHQFRLQYGNTQPGA